MPCPGTSEATGSGRGVHGKATRPGATGVVDLSPFGFLDRLAAIIPPPRCHRHRYHGVFAPNRPLRPAVTAMAIGNLAKQSKAVMGEDPAGAAVGDCCEAADRTGERPCSHDTS